MADHFVDAGADALGVAFVAQVGGGAAVLDGVVVYPLVDLLGGDAGADVIGNIIQDADVDFGTALDALDVVRALQRVMVGQQKALLVELFHVHVEGCVALLVFLTASTPTGVVAAESGFIPIHGDPFAK